MVQSKVRSDDDIRRALSRINWNFGDYNPSERAPEIHGLHWYPALFPPGLAGTLIEVLGAGGTYVDPYSGSAVGPVEAWLRGYSVAGIDINPVANEIARTKVNLLRHATADAGMALQREYLHYREEHFSFTYALPSHVLCEEWDFDADAMRWFSHDILSELAIVKRWITEGTVVSLWRDVVKVLVSAVLHKPLSELREVHYTYIVDRSRTKRIPTHSINGQQVITEKIRQTFVQFEVARHRLERAEMMPSPQQADPYFISGSSDECLAQLTTDIDLVVTSPPYFGMNDYVRSQYLTQLIFPDEQYQSHLDLEIGTRRNRNSPIKANEYLTMLSKTFKQIGAKASVGACVAVILGTSRASQDSIRPSLEALETSLYGSDLYKVWSGTRRVLYRKINNTPFREEHIWVFRKER